jgi:hypothetical protein
LLAKHENYELPMTPITMMRNALGKEEGGRWADDKNVDITKFPTQNTIIAT